MERYKANKHSFIFSRSFKLQFTHADKLTGQGC